MEVLLSLIGMALLLCFLVLPVVAVVMLRGLKRDTRMLSERQADILHALRALKNRIGESAQSGGAAASGPVESEPPPMAGTPRPASAKIAVVTDRAAGRDATTTSPSPPIPSPVTSVPPPLPAAAREAPPVPSRTPPCPPEPSRTVENARRTLRGIWNWILVGDRQEGVTFEFALASRWLLILGIVALVACVGYFLMWSIQQQLIGPLGRVAISILAGIGMLAGGLRLLGRKYHLIGQGLLGGGIVTLYFSMQAAGPMYHLLPISAVFPLMILVTLTAGVLAIRTDSLLIAILGILGGYATPVLLRTPTPNLPVFYAYILLLGIGILGMAFRKQWRLLNYLGFICTYVLFFGSLSVYDKTTDFAPAISFLSAFFVVHSAIVYLYNIVKKQRSTVPDIIHLVLNAAVYASVGYALIKSARGRPYPAVMSLGLSLFFTAHVLVFLRRRLVDRALVVALIALAGGFAALTLPLVLEKESLTICLSLLAFVFLWLGAKMNSAFLESLGHLLYGVVFFRLLFMDLPRNYRHAPSASMPISDYWIAMADRIWTFGLSIASVFGGFLLQRKRPARNRRLVLNDANDVGGVISPEVAGNVFYWFAVLFAFVFLQFELNAMFVYREPLRLPVLTWLWCGMAAFFLWRCLAAMNERPAGNAALPFGAGILLAGMCIFIGAAVLKLLTVDVASWKLTESFYYNIDYGSSYAGVRLLDYGAALAFLFGAWAVLSRRGIDRRMTAVLGYGGLALLFAYASLELNSLLHWRLRNFQEGGISVLWSLFAIAFISGGIWKNVAPLRYIGLGLFGIVVGKVFLLDLSDMEIIYRVIAFMAVGIILVMGSFAYIFSNRKFTSSEEGETS